MFASVISGWKWFMASPIAQGIAALIAAAIGYKVWKMNVEHGVRRQMREQHEREQAEERVRVIERTNEIITEERNNADEALQARDSGGAPAAYDELPDAHKRIAEGRARPR